MAELIVGGFVTQPEGCPDQHLVAFRPIDQFHVGKFGVRNRDQCPVEPSHPDRTYTDVLDSSHLVAEAAEIAFTDWFVREEDDAADQVLKRRPHGQGDRQAANTKTAQRSEGTLHLTGPNLIASDGAATRITDTVRKSGENR